MSIRLPALLIGWFVAALLVGASGVMEGLTVPPPVIVFILVAAALLLVRLSPSLREDVRALGVRPLVGFHIVRLLAGAYFLWLYRRGVLPGEFAAPAGWGDIAVAIGAVVVLLFCAELRSPAQRLGLLVWNVAGLIDIVGVLANAARMLPQDPALGRLFSGLPLALLPIFVVPLVIVSHVLLFGRVRAGSRANEIPAPRRAVAV